MLLYEECLFLNENFFKKMKGKSIDLNKIKSLDVSYFKEKIDFFIKNEDYKGLKKFIESSVQILINIATEGNNRNKPEYKRIKNEIKRGVTFIKKYEKDYDFNRLVSEKEKYVEKLVSGTEKYAYSPLYKNEKRTFKY